MGGADRRSRTSGHGPCSAPRQHRRAAYREPAFFTIVNYEQVVADARRHQRRLAPDVVILDEAQRIKNWKHQDGRGA